MKLSKTTWLALGIGIFVIAAASIGVVYAQEGREQSRLNQELSLAQLRLDKYLSEPPSSQKEELESQLAQVELQLKDGKAALYQSIESIEATDILFDIAEDCDVEIIDVGSSFPTNRKLENITYSALPLRVTIEGDVPALINFILKWTEQYSTGIVTAVEITVPEPIEEEAEAEEGETEGEGEEEEGEEEEEEEEKPSAELTLFIYTYEGD